METVLHPEKRKKKKITWRIGIVFSILSFLVLALSVAVGLMLTRPMREEITKTPANYQLEFENISFPSQYDGVTLHGWWIPAKEGNNPSTKTVIFSHGYGDSRAMKQINALTLAKTLVDEGYNVLTFDYRASGDSEGRTVTLGQYEQYDLLTAITYAKERKKSKEISLLGWSMGAATAILAGEKSNDVAKVIADSPYYDLTHYLKSNLPHWSKLPAFPFTPIIMGIIPPMTGLDPKEVSPVSSVKQYKEKSLFLIHSTTDKAIPYENSQRILNNFQNKERVKLWLTEGGGHIESYVTHKEEYEERVLAFLSK